MSPIHPATGLWLLVCAVPVLHAENYTNVTITPSTEVNMQFYELNTPAGRSVQQQLLQAAPQGAPGRRAVGKAVYQLSWELDTSQRASVCQLYGVKVKTRIALTMPNWLQLATRPADQQGQWTSFLGAMQEYEGRHKGMVQEAASQLGQTLSALPVNPSCQALQSEADQAGAAALQQLRQQVQRYQQESGHGQSLGVKLPAL